jgi:acyl-CoA synthetase (AMP-forming)/AMP-acid ligase II
LEDQPELVCEEIRSFLTGEELKVAKKPWSNLNGTRSYLASTARVNPFYKSFEELAHSRGQLEAVSHPIFFRDELHVTRYSYSELFDRVSQYRRGLTKLGLKPGERVLMLVKPGIDFLALSYAVMGNGATPCFLDPGMGKEKLLACIQHLKPSAFIGSPKAHLLRLLYKSFFKDMNFHIIVSDWGLPRSKNLSYLKRFAALSEPAIESSAPALIAYTSGATGTPKAVVYDAEMATAQVSILRDQFGLSVGERDVPLLPIFSLFHLALGVTSIFAPLNPAKPLEFDPEKLLMLMNSEQATTSFGSPTLWGKLSEYALRTNQKLRTMRRVFMAGAPVSPRLVTQVKRVLGVDDSEIFTPYGATEALPVTLVSGTEIVDQEPQYASTGELGTFVGKPVTGVEIRIYEPFSDTESVAESELRISAEGRIGEVLVCGANVSKEYFENWDANALSKIHIEGRLWHRMGDLGYVIDGKLYFCGRKAHSFVHRGRRLCSVPIERIFNEHERVKRSALISLQGDGEEPAIVIEPEPAQFPKTPEQELRFEQELLEFAKRDPLSGLMRRVLFHPSFPVDPRHNAKVYSDKLQRWARNKVSVDSKGFSEARS